MFLVCSELIIGDLILHPYGLLIAVGIIVGMGLCLWLAPKHNMSRDVVVDLLLCMVAGGLVGAKSLAVIVNLKNILNGAMTFLQALSVTVVYGGIIGALLACAVYCKIKKVDFWGYSDLCLSCVAITQGIGRLGCLMAGCCYGIEYSGFGAITFTNSPFAPNNTPLFPSQIVSSLFMLIFGIILLVWCSKHKHKPGDIGTTYILVYGLARSFIENYRGDLERGFILGMSTSQFISIFFVALGFGIKLWKYKQKEQEKENL